MEKSNETTTEQEMLEHIPCSREEECNGKHITKIWPNLYKAGCRQFNGYEFAHLSVSEMIHTEERKYTVESSSYKIARARLACLSFLFVRIL